MHRRHLITIARCVIDLTINFSVLVTLAPNLMALGKQRRVTVKSAVLQ